MSDATPSTDTLTVVLVHGAFADASSWNPVVEQLQAKGIDVAAPPNPLRGISHRLRLHRQLLPADPRAACSRSATPTGAP